MRLKQSLTLAALFVCTTIANAGLPDALRALERGDFDTAINELRPLLDPGSAEIQTLLGQALIGKGGSAQSLAEAVSFLRQAATSGNQKAMLLLSRLLETNKYVPQDDKESLKWLLVLAEQKNPFGLVLLSKRYDEGRGVPQSAVISHALSASSALFPKEVIQDAEARFGANKRSITAKLIAELEKPGNFLNALGNANRDAIAFNQKYASYPPAVRDRLLEVEVNDLDAMVKIGSLYLYGEQRVPRDPRHAAIWFNKAASKGNANAKDYLAGMYAQGVGVEQSYSKAYAMYSELAQGGNLSAATELGILYKDGLGTAKDAKKAIFWLRKGLTQFSQGLYPLSQMYAEGLGMEKNLVLALALSRNSSSLSPTEFRLGKPAVDNPATAFASNLKEQLSPHDIAASHYLASRLLNASVNDRLLEEIDLAAAKGPQGLVLPPAEVAEYFLNSYDEKNIPLALSLLAPLVENKDAAAAYLMGEIYATGNGVPQNIEKAEQYFEFAEQEGNVDALSRKAYLYYRGEGRPKDMAKAFALFERASEGGNLGSRIQAAEMLFNGLGVERNSEKAKQLYEQAASSPQPYLSSAARSGLAKIYLSENKLALALQNFKLAASEGDKEALLEMAKLYFNGIDVPSIPTLSFALTRLLKDEEKFRTAAATLGSAISQKINPEEQKNADQLVATLHNLLRYGSVSKKDSTKFLETVNNLELAKSQR